MAGGGTQGKMTVKEARIFKKDFRFPDADFQMPFPDGKNQGPAMTLGWRPEILAQPQRTIETTNREIPPFPEKCLGAES